ncbi:hypothetical protein GKZ28_00875 [Clostridium chromiireducens]|uniref:Uncharacterized protein n=1 Tax=Clostridium chromiireducens TaxID=225345 RepID=A0A964RIH5_9CLOT|nr:hypothetical protein [Clostridium chromiireducens]MVX62253.1 hypothetical protein [Clostridium chromiireducens]
MRKKIKLNVKFVENEVVCAKSPIGCKGCDSKSNCECLELYYYPFAKKEIEECFRNDERNR